MQERARIKGSSAYLSIVYDDLFRRTMAQRVEQCDPSLKWDEAWSLIDKQVLEACELRLAQVLRNAGVSESSSPSGRSPLPQPDGVNPKPASLDGALAKTTAATEAVSRRVSEITKSLQSVAHLGANQTGFGNYPPPTSWEPPPQPWKGDKGWDKGYDKGKGKGKDKGKGKGKGWKGKGKFPK